MRTSQHRARKHQIVSTSAFEVFRHSLHFNLGHRYLCLRGKRVKNVWQKCILFCESFDVITRWLLQWEPQQMLQLQAQQTLGWLPLSPLVFPLLLLLAAAASSGVRIA